jgi:homoserine dehydrogenase
MIKIALLGFGNVGRAFARYLLTTDAGNSRRCVILGIADITGGLLLEHAEDAAWMLQQQELGQTVADCAQRGTFLEIPAFIDALPHAGISLLVECLPTNPIDGQPALSLVRRALERRVAVVTVDKGPMVYGFQALTDAARSNGTRLAYSGTTGVRPPPALAGCHILEIRGILNGTTNFILTEMQERGLPFKQALAKARDEGIAEPNPELDIQGWDSACKLLILANEWMAAAASLGDVVRIGIGPETEDLIRDARESAGVVRLVARARYWEGCVRLSVAPKIVGHNTPFYAISGTSKGAVFRTRERGDIFVAARSGRDAIAQVILEDIQEISACAADTQP